MANSLKLGELEIDLDELSLFIVNAKKNCYAGNGAEKKLPDGSRLLMFQEGNFYYEDSYDGYYQAPGREIVRWKKLDGQRIWQMSYSGEMLPEYIGNEEFAKKTFSFLKEALLTVTPDMPFRGEEKKIFHKEIDGEHWFYETKTKGDTKNFSGQERIFTLHSKKEVFIQNYIGGIITPK